MIFSQDQITIIDEATQIEEQLGAFSSYNDLVTAYTDPPTGETFVLNEAEIEAN